MEFSGKHVLVTGGTRGIGRAIAVMFASQGANVAFTYALSTVQAQEVLEVLCSHGVKALAIQADVRDFSASKEAIERVKGEFGGLDILVNNAGVTRDKALMMMSPEEWEEVMDTNLQGTFNFCRNAIITFLKQKSGCIINLTSVSGMIGMSRQTNYAASKAGIIGFTRSLAREVGGYGIRVNAVAPGFVETDMVAHLKEQFTQAMKQAIPLGRFGTSGEVAAVVRFLASEEARFITGQTLVVDGGLSLAL
jgi:3-oxoacyl-[acyl-carrier protein] reductase